MGGDSKTSLSNPLQGVTTIRESYLFLEISEGCFRDGCQRLNKDKFMLDWLENKGSTVSHRTCSSFWFIRTNTCTLHRYIYISLSLDLCF